MKNQLFHTASQPQAGQLQLASIEHNVVLEGRFHAFVIFCEYSNHVYLKSYKYVLLSIVDHLYTMCKFGITHTYVVPSSV